MNTANHHSINHSANLISLNSSLRFQLKTESNEYVTVSMEKKIINSSASSNLKIFKKS